jgi:hypothetical protein
MLKELATLFAAALMTACASTGSVVGFTAVALGVLYRVFDGAEVPAEFTARAVNEYCTPFVSPVTTQFGVLETELSAEQVPATAPVPTFTAVMVNESGCPPDLFGVTTTVTWPFCGGKTLAELPPETKIRGDLGSSCTSSSIDARSSLDEPPAGINEETKSAIGAY